MIAWEIEAKGALASPILDDSGNGHFPENHANTGTTRVPERRVRTRTVHVRVDMTTKVRIPRRNDEPTMLPWTP